MLRLMRTGRCWVKFTAGYRFSAEAPPYLDIAPFARKLVETMPDRLLWGSDCPFVGHEASGSYADTLEELSGWFPDAGTRRKLSDTALKLYFS